MKVVLSNAPRGGGAIERSKLPPLGLGYLAAAVEQAGHHVTIVDAHNYDLSVEELADRVVDLKPDVYGMSALTHNRFSAMEVMERVKGRTGALIAAGGPHFALSARDALENVDALDVIAKGEAEGTFVEIIAAHGKGESFDDVAGVFFRSRSGEIVETSDRPEQNDLDALPDVAWHRFNMEDYDRPIDGTSIRSLGVMSTRGCPNRCIFCTNAAFLRGKMRRRSPRKFVDEIVLLKERYGIGGFSFWDDTFTIVRRHMLGICDELIRRQMNIQWYARARVNTVDRAILKKMKDAGCCIVSFGVESGSPRILERIRKDITLEQARTAVGDCVALGLPVRLNFIMSHPDETLDDVKMSLALMRELEGFGPDVQCDFGMLVIYPGTELETIARERGCLPRDFSWHRYREFPKALMAGFEPWMPYFEQPEMPLEEIRALIYRDRFSPGQVIRKGWRRLGRVRSLGDLRTTVKMTGKYVAGFFR